MAEQDTGLAPDEAAPQTQQPAEDGETAAPEQGPKSAYTQAEVDEIIDKVKATHKAKMAKAYRQQQKLKAQFESAIPEALHEQREEPGEPKRKDDESYEDFVARRAEFVAERAARKALQAADQGRRAQAEAQSQEEVAANWKKAKEAGAKKYADFDEVTGQDDLLITVAMGRAIQESDVGHEVAYYLGKHPEEAEDIAGMSVSGQLRAIGRLEEKLAQPKAPTRQPAAPITPVEGRAPANNLELHPNLDNEEWNRRWDLRQAQRARERAGR